MFIGSLVPALARVLVDDGKRSMELCNNILQVFLMIALDENNHSLLLQNRAGDSSMKIIQRELNRFELWRSDIVVNANGERTLASDKVERIKTLLKKQDELLEISFRILYYLSSDINVEVKMVKRDIIGYIIDGIKIQLQKGELMHAADGKGRRYADDTTWEHPQAMPHPPALQNILEFLLKLLAFRENHNRILEAITKQKSEILKHIFHIITRPDSSKTQHLALQTAVSMCQTNDLRKLICSEVDGYLDKFALLMGDPSRDTANLSILLMTFYSLTPEGRHRITDTSIIPVALKTVLDSKTDGKTLKQAGNLLCNLAQDETAALMICGLSPDSKEKSPAGLKLLVKRAIKNHVGIIWKLMRVIAASQSQIIKMSFLHFVDDIMKYCHNLDPNAPFKILSANELPEEEFTIHEQEAVAFVAIIGIMGSIEIPEFDYSKLNSRYNLVELISTYIQVNLHLTRRSLRNPTVNDEADFVKSISLALEPSDDLLLECIILLGTMFQDVEFTTHVYAVKLSTAEAQALMPPTTVSRPTAASGRKTSTQQLETSFPQLLLETIQLKQDDPEILYQTIRTIYSLIRSSHEVCAQVIEQHPQLIDELAQLIWDPSPEISDKTGLCLSLMEQVERSMHVSPKDQIDANGARQLGRVGRMLRERRFQYMHADWVMAVQDDVMQLAEHYDSQFYEQEEDGAINRLSVNEGLMMSRDEVFMDTDAEGRMLDMGADENDGGESENVLMNIGGQQLRYV